MKLAAADGEILWRIQDEETAQLDDRGWAIVVGPDDHPVVTGMHSTLTDPADYRTFKLDNADGSEIWSRTMPGAINFIGRKAGWLAVCDDGDVVMVNSTWELTTAYDVVLHRYAVADGATVWGKRYNSGGSASEDPVHMVRDADGDLLVAGVRSGDFLAMKFDDADGELLWSAAYDGPAAGYDAAAAVLEGPEGDVIVTGFTTGTSTSWDVATVAFEATDGALRWDAHFDSGEGGSDEGKALAVSPQGDLYVVGSCDLSFSATDLLALRYSLTDATGVPNAPLAAASSALRIAAHPNPFVQRLMLSVDIAHAAPARLTVYDVRGRRAARLHEGPLARGTHRFEWNGRDDSGALLVSGVYFVRLESDGTSAVEKVVLSR